MFRKKNSKDNAMNRNINDIWKKCPGMKLSTIRTIIWCFRDIFESYLLDGIIDFGAIARDINNDPGKFTIFPWEHKRRTTYQNLKTLTQEDVDRQRKNPRKGPLKLVLAIRSELNGTTPEQELQKMREEQEEKDYQEWLKTRPQQPQNQAKDSQ